MAPLRRRDLPEDLNEVTEVIVDSAVEVHRHLRAGHREAHYEEALVMELTARGRRVERQVPFQLSYKDRPLGGRLVCDLIVDSRVIVEVKAVEELHGLHEAQLISYLAASGIEAGLLLNFNAPTMRGQMRRFLRPRAPIFRSSVAAEGRNGNDCAGSPRSL